MFHGTISRVQLLLHMLQLSVRYHLKSMVTQHPDIFLGSVSQSKHQLVFENL